MQRSECVFVKWESGGFGVFFTRHYFEMLISFYYAKEKAITWGDFWCLCSPALREFCAEFLGNDDNSPSKEDLLADIAGDVWILSDQEFPITQCAEETTKLLGLGFLSEYGVESFKTEYGEMISLFSLDRVGSIVKEADRLGVDVEVVNSPFPGHIYNYAS